MLCQMTINFAAEASKTSHDLLKDLQARVSSGQVGNLKVDATHILSMESVPSKFLLLAHCGECDMLFFQRTAKTSWWSQIPMSGHRSLQSDPVCRSIHYQGIMY